MVKNNYILSVLKGVVISLLFAIIAILLFSVILRIFSLSNGVIKPVNYVIKIVEIFLGTYLTVKENHGALKGLVTGVIIVIITFVFFSIIGGGFTFDIDLLWETLLGGAVGSITGIFAVNKKAKR